MSGGGYCANKKQKKKKIVLVKVHWIVSWRFLLIGRGERASSTKQRSATYHTSMSCSRRRRRWWENSTATADNNENNNKTEMRRWNSITIAVADGPSDKRKTTNDNDAATAAKGKWFITGECSLPSFVTRVHSNRLNVVERRTNSRWI